MEVDTLGNAFAAGWRVFARCKHGQQDHGTHARRCSYRAELDLETLVWTRGRDFPLSRLQVRLKCPRCGFRRIAVMFESPTNAAVA
jgi:hypothetical protein